MDIVVALDISGSMSGALIALQWRLGDLVERLVERSAGDIRLGLVGFNQSILVLRDLEGTPGEAQITAFLTVLGRLDAYGGDNVPELSAEALHTVLDRLPAAGRPQLGDFTGRFEARNRLLIVITDQHPGGFDDAFGAEDLALVDAVTRRAADLGVRISAIYVPTEVWPVAEIEAILRSYADGTGGVFAMTDRRGAGVPQAIVDIVALCGAGALM